VSLETGLGSFPNKRFQLKVSNGLIVLEVMPLVNPERVSWRLPPSKSHMIRWIAMAAQSKSETELHFSGTPGDDIFSMADCMEKMGMKIQKGRGKWVVKRGLNDNLSSETALDCGNSATTARVVTSIAAGMGSVFHIDGDDSLRRRDTTHLNDALRELGCNISDDSMPFSISGPIRPRNATVDQSESSQTLTGLILASPRFPNGARIFLKGRAVSRGYRDLTIDICRVCGWEGGIDSGIVDIGGWTVKTPEVVEIPEEISLLPISLLYDRLHDTKSMKIEIVNSDTRILEAINSVMECNGGVVDLRDASDLISPAASIIALGEGGKIVGSSHAKGKETDRIDSTFKMLSSFGISTEKSEDGLIVPGGQWPTSPSKPVNSHNDHRLAMTAIVLASLVGASIYGEDSCSVTHPDFIEMILGETGGK